MWEKVRLGDVCEIFGGSTPSTKESDFWNGDILWLSPSDLPEVGEISIVSNTERKITNTAIAKTKLKVLPKGSVVFSSRASIGKIGITANVLTTNQGFVNFVCGERVLNRYLAYCLKSSIPAIKKLGNSTTFLEVSRNSIRDFKIPLPPLPVQQRIADMLDKADALRRKDQELLKKYDELAQAIFIEMFGEYLNQNLTTLFDEIVINPSKKEVTINNDSKVSFIPMAHVGETGELNLTLSKSYEEVRTGFTYFRENDVLFAKITPCMENGKGAIARNLVRGIGFGSTEFHVLRPNEKIVAEFIYYWLSMPKVRKDAELNMTGSAGQKRVPVNFFSKLYFSVPPIELQRQFATRIEIINQLKAEANAEKSEELFQSLLQRVFKSALVK
ncbi:MAG TPA: restriction endonuclease subunit S [Parapedobacter sp.]|uniref:restriction endonuclease subunit S n=1 Tax=Parapedobacter sp. TaxID=1958893 RepID=UPI002BCB3C86|nr:restriction endonuclease subunit S [Parapedobacter sp.]HWK55748.1 restriction endonuclease subunit S [Parapedobacter sp.]